MPDLDNQQPDESISNPVAHVHHYVLKGSGLSCWAECANEHPAWVDDVMPYRGECGICGGDDARHRMIDAMTEYVAAGDSVETVAEDYGYPANFVQRLCDERESFTVCGHKLAGDNGPIVGSRQRVEKAMAERETSAR